MHWLRNRAIQVAVAATAFYWLLVLALGSSLARDAVDVMVTIVCIAFLFRILPHALDRFLRGGGEKSWQVIIGMALVFSALPVLAMWAFGVRFYDRYDPAVAEWMRASPLNGFFRLWSFMAVLMVFSAITELPEGKQHPASYYVTISLLAGFFIGAATIKIALDFKLL